MKLQNIPIDTEKPGPVSEDNSLAYRRGYLCAKREALEILVDTINSRPFQPHRHKQLKIYLEKTFDKMKLLSPD